MLTVYEYSDENVNAKACLLAFVIELKKRIENKEFLKVNISENVYNKISKEEFKDSKLVNGQQFSINNETDSVITNGNGEKTLRNESGDILSKEVFTNFEIAYVETYHLNGTP